MMKNRQYQSKRSAVSTIVGSLFFLILMVGGFTALLSALQFQSELVTLQRELSEQEISKTQEEFSFVASVKLPANNNQLYVNVTNHGSTLLEIVDLWVINKTSTQSPPYQARVFDIDYRDTSVPPGSTTMILTNQPIYMKNGDHDIKIVSKRGNVQLQQLIVPLDPLRAKIYVSPPHVANGNNATVFMEIFNRGNATVYNVKPTKTPSGSSTGQVTPNDAIGSVDPSTNTPINLEPQESATFKWNYHLFGAIGTEVLFKNTATGTDSVTGETVTSPEVYDKVKFIPAPRLLLQVPEISMIVPSPFGETGSGSSTQSGLWGVYISNPTDTNISITRIIISAITPLARTGHIPTTCSPAAFSPTTSSEWSCPVVNTLKWENLATPLSVPAREARAFMTKIKTGALTGSGDDPAFTITVTVFSSYGQSARAGFISGVKQSANSALVNVFFSNLAGGVDPVTTNSAILGVVSASSGSVAKQFNVTLADFSGGSASEGVLNGAQMIVNVPAGFRSVSASSPTNCPTGANPSTSVGFSKFNVGVPTIFPDGSTQITATLRCDIGVNAAESASITFTTDVPVVSSKAVYLMFVLATGSTTTGAFPVGAIAEVTVAVTP